MSRRRIGADQHRSGTQLHRCCERGIDVAFVACVQYLYLLADGACCVLNFSRLIDVKRTVGIEQDSDQPEPRNKRAQQAKPVYSPSRRLTA